MTHNKDINEDIRTYPEWELHVSQEVGIWKRWHHYWLDKARNKKVPVYFFRFEDLLADPIPELKTILSLAL